VRTCVGYTGGTKPAPTYRSLGDPTESIQVEYDPTKITYARLLEVFFAAHDPTWPSGAPQYMNFVCVADPAQEQAARAAAAAVAKRLGKPVLTELRAATTFWPAEDYHQKYALRADRTLMAEVARWELTAAEFRASSAVARLNAYVAGDGTVAQLERELASLGLSADGAKYLDRLVRTFTGRIACGND